MEAPTTAAGVSLGERLISDDRGTKTKSSSAAEVEPARSVAEGIQLVIDQENTS